MRRNGGGLSIILMKYLCIPNRSRERMFRLMERMGEALCDSVEGMMNINLSISKMCKGDSV